MIRILLVEDDANKREALAQVIYSVTNLPDECLEIAVDVNDAKRKLQARGFDLLLLDIHLPRRADKEPDPGGGLEIVRWLKGRGKEHRPSYIVGTTVYGESFELAQSEFDNLIWTVIAFSFSDNSWKSKLIATLMLICDQITPPYSTDGVTFKTDLLIVAALESPELRAVLDVPLIWQDVRVRFDDTRYHAAKYDIGNRNLSIVAVSASDKGLSSAAVATTKAILAFRPRFVAMIGICAGVKGRVNIGDIVVADPSWDWGSGKTKMGADGDEFFQAAQYQMRLDETLRSLVSQYRSNPQRLQKAYELYTGKKPSNAPNVHVGAFASGAAVLQSRAAVERILEHHKDLIAVDMEVYSVMYACHVASHPRPKCLTVKSVSDFGDDEKSDNYQAYAAFSSAAFLFELMPSLFA